MEKYLSPEQVCELVPGMTTGLLAQLRFRGVGGPRYVKPSPRKVVYSASAIEEWLRANERTGTRDPISA